MHLDEWMEKARGHKYIRKYVGPGGKTYYEYQTPGGQKVSVPSRGAAKEETQPKPAPKVEPAKPAAAGTVSIKEAVKKVAEKAKKTETPAPTPKEAREGAQKLNSKEENEKLFGLASDVVRAAIPKADRGATLKAARAMLDLAKQPGQKGKVLKEIRALVGEARKHAKTMNNRYNADRYKDKPPKGRKAYTYEDVLAARSVRDLLDKARAKVQEIKTSKKAEKPTQEVEAKLKVPPEAKAEVKQEKAEAEKDLHKEPNFRGFGGQAFKFDIPGTAMTAEVDQNPDQRSIGRYELLQMTVKNRQGEVQGTLDAVLEAGVFRSDSTRIEGDIPGGAKPLLEKMLIQGIAQRDAINEKEREARLRPKRHPSNTITYTEKVVDHAKLKRQGGAGFGMGGKIPTKKVQSSRSVSLSDEHYANTEAFLYATKNWAPEAHMAAAAKYREIASSHAEERTATAYRHAANAHAAMAKEQRALAKIHRQMSSSGADLAGVGSHLGHLNENLGKSMTVGDWLQKADDNKPGEGQADGKEEMADDKGKGEGDDKDDKDKEGDKDGEEMEKAPGLCKACGKKHDPMMKCGMVKSMLDDWIQKSLPTHEQRMGGPKSDAIGGSQDGGDVEGKGKTADSNGGPVNAPGIDAQGKVTGTEPGKQEKLSEDDEEQGELGKPDKKKPIEKLGKSELYPAPLTPARQREMLAHATAKLRKSPEMVTIGPQNHPYGYQQTMGADVEALSKAEDSTDIPRLSYSPGQSLAQSQVLCKSIRANGCDAQHSAMLTACPECGVGVTQQRIWPNSSEIDVIPQPGPGGLRPAKRAPMIKIS